MDHNGSHQTISLIFISVMVLPFFQTALAEGPGPVNPGSDNTIAQYCKTGVCVVNGSYYLNATKGFSLFGNATGGIQRGNSTLYGIQLSDTCIKMEEKNIPSGCLNYSQMKFLDNTNPAYAGQWTNGTWYHRLAATTRQSWNFVTGKNVVMVDPDSDFAARAKMITVTNSGFTFINPGENVTNHIRTEYHDRWVSSDCTNAIVAPNLWLLNDTLHYLESDCTFTKYNGTSLALTPFFQLQYHTVQMKTVNWLAHFAINGTTKITQDCIIATVKCNIPSDPYHSHNPKFGW